MPELEANQNPDGLDEEEMLSALLSGGVLLASQSDDASTVSLLVRCSDLFAWACADAENLPYDQIGPLYLAWKNDLTWGVDKWCCKQRNQRPQKYFENLMRSKGAWDEGMESLPLNTQDAETQAAFACVAQQQRENHAV